MMIRCYCGENRQGGGLTDHGNVTYTLAVRTTGFVYDSLSRRGGQQRFVQVCRCRAASYSQLEAREERLTQADASRADAQKQLPKSDGQLQ
jgi:hypothetical protein